MVVSSLMGMSRMRQNQDRFDSTPLGNYIYHELKKIKCENKCENMLKI
jgi:hypothetical protein